MLHHVPTVKFNGKAYEDLKKTFVFDIPKKPDYSYLGISKSEWGEAHEVQSKKAKLKNPLQVSHSIR